MFTLTTDTSVDIFKSELDRLDVPWLPLTFTIGDAANEDRFTTDEEYENFYAKLVTGALPVTSQINPATHEEFFESVYNSRKKAIVHIALSGGLSKTYESACAAAKSLMEKNPDIKVYVIDSLAATVASQPVFERALKLRGEDEDAATAADALRTYAHRIQTYIIPDDLNHLKRGGRVSAASAAVGTVFNIKPIIIFDEAGKLQVYKKAIGFNRALKIVLDHIEQHCPNVAEKKIWIADACAHEQAETAKKAIEARFGCKTQTGWIGPIIGTHTGHGTIGIVFEANSRLF